MPVTAKLSKLFYERLGDQIANELAEWLNQVDQSYRSDLRELNEVNFARFDAKLEQRLAELRTGLITRVEAVRTELNVKFAELEARMERRFGDMERRFGDMERRLTEHNRWLIGIFVTTVLGFAGLGLGLAGLWLRH